MSGVHPSSKSSSDKPFAQLIGRIRKTNELTQASFGKLFEPQVTQSTIARWEKGEQMPDSIHFPKIAYFLDLTLEELQILLEEPFKNPESLYIEKKTLSPNKKHLKLLKRGVTTWNRWREKNPDVIPELAGAKLDTYELEGINLDRADLRGVELSDVHLENSSLENANLSEANLKHVYFKSTNLDNANFGKAQLRYVHFDEAKLVEADFHTADMNDISFQFANLSDANLNDAIIIRGEFQEANCNRASFNNTKIYDSSVYGASFWGSKFDGVKLEDIYISEQGKEGFPVNDIEFAQNIYLQRRNRLGTKKFVENFQLEEEAINLAYTLADKYGSYSHINESSAYFNYQIASHSPPYVQAHRRKGYFETVLHSRYIDNSPTPSEKAEARTIIQIHDEIIESNLEIEDVNILRKTVELTEKIQRERVNQFVPIALKILELKKSNKTISEEYILEKTDEEIILFEKSELNIEQMRVNFTEKPLKVLRSNLEDKCLMCFQKILIDLVV